MIAVEERRLKGLLKNAVAEVLEEHRDLLRDAVRESFEDVALIRAIPAVKTIATTRTIRFKLEVFSFSCLKTMEQRFVKKQRGSLHLKCNRRAGPGWRVMASAPSPAGTQPGRICPP
jgi:hypothetical protein